MKLNIKLLIVVLVSLWIAGVPMTICAADNDYQPLTEEEAEQWLRSVPLETVIDFVIKFDYVEHTKPVILAPELLAVMTKDGDLLLESVSPGEIRIGHLEYTYKLPTVTYKDFHKEKSCLPGILIGSGIGFTLGVLFSGLVAFTILN